MTTMTTCDNHRGDFQVVYGEPAVVYGEPVDRCPVCELEEVMRELYKNYNELEEDLEFGLKLFESLVEGQQKKLESGEIIDLTNSGPNR
jgi:hypothetical protein